MAWRRLTVSTEILTADVNMDNVCYMLEMKDHTVLYFIGGQGEKFLSLSVKETVDEIHAGDEIRPQSKTTVRPIGFNG
jgi:hypothetical protein